MCAMRQWTEPPDFVRRKSDRHRRDLKIIGLNHGSRKTAVNDRRQRRNRQ
jgi:hypothetical protein